MPKDNGICDRVNDIYIEREEYISTMLDSFGQRL